MFIAAPVLGQSEYAFGALPSLNLNKDLGKGYKLNFELESRQVHKQGLFEESNPFGYDYILTDFTNILAKEVAFNKTIAIGYLFRVRGRRIIHRSIQQYIWTKEYEGVKIAHRVATDQTFESSANPQFRFRYRLASQIALNGHSADPGEFYLKINNEYLNQLDRGDYDLEVRLTPFLGYTFTNTQKLEFGMDYRVNSFLNDSALHLFWIAINYYLSL